MRHGWSILFAIAFTFASLLAVGCGRQPEADVIFLTTSEHNDLDPQRISWLHDSRVVEQMFEPLVVHDFTTHETKPGVAESWDISDDGMTYTFHLREDARWSNGDPVTANDFVFAWRRALTPDLAAQYARMLYRIEGAEAFLHWRTEQIEQYAQVSRDANGGRGEIAEQVWQLAEDRFEQSVGVTAEDDRTLVVRLERPAPYFLELVAFITFYPVHARSVQEAMTLDPATGMWRMDTRYWSDPNRLVSNGAYKLAGRRFRQYVHMTANEHYWNAGQVQNASIMERIVSDPQNAMTTYRRGGANFWPGVPAGAMASELVRDDRRNDVHTQTMAGTYFYNFNCMPQLRDGRDNPFADPRVRRAFSKAIDRDTIVQRVTRMNQPVAMSYIPPDVIGDYNPPTEHGITFDPERARELLAEAGYPNGEGLTGLSILYNTGAEHGDIAQAIRRMWEQHLGVSVSLESVEVNAFFDRLRSQDYVIARASWFGDYPDPTSWLDRMLSDDANNNTAWSNEAFDALLTEAANETEPSARLALLREAEALLLDEQPMAMIFQYVSVNLWNPDQLEGLNANPWAKWNMDRIRVRR
ncbi:peptide ABC transporter substrate-binding protein [Phycisphaerales bacterium AB-hyl4]|uniref:Peptide ABC transporter substrate-binding protein n=1 Tax=Natronomicrosphaera hydrolytica TaxID=3242702 RepID=A0ABV4U509_9BACT